MFDLSLEDLRGLHAKFDEDVRSVFDYDNSVEKKNSIGGTSSSSVKEQVDRMNTWLAAFDKQ